MFKGYAEFGSVEVVNVARLMKYAREGSVVPGLRLDPQVGDYADLAAALGDPDYRSVILDSPPWYDATNPDSADFAGLMPLEFTGLDGSTRTRSVIEGLGDGGRPGSSRAVSRTIGVSTVALAATDAGLEAGLSWLAGALHPPCPGGDGCRGTALNVFSSSPVYCDLVANLDGDLVTTKLLPAEATYAGPSLAYSDLYGGGLLPPSCGPVTVTAVVATGLADSGLPHVAVMSLVDSTGTVYASTAVTALDDGGAESTLTLTIDPTPGFPSGWQPVLFWYDDTGGVPDVYFGGDSSPETDEVDDFIDGGSSTIDTSPFVDGGDSDEPHPGYGGELRVISWEYTSHPMLTTDDCLADLRRSYRNVVTVEGPTVIQEYTDDLGAPYAARVEWTWVATDPLPYGDTSRLIDGLLVGRATAATNPAVYVATTTDLSLFAPPTGHYYVDGLDLNGYTIAAGGPGKGGAGLARYNPVYGARVLVRSQALPRDNGVYVYNGPGQPLTRADDLDIWAEAVGAVVYVQKGETLYNTTWGSDATGGGTIGVTAMPWSAGTPGGAFYDDGISYRAAGLQISDNAEVSGASTACTPPSPVIVLCGDDPDLPVITPPPLPPTLPDPGMPTVTTYVRRAVQIPPLQSPQPGAVLTMAITNLGETDYRGIRVRLWADPDPDFGVDEECDFDQELYVTYLAAGQTVTIDGPDHTVTTTCIGGIDADHERNMRGAYGGPFVFPDMRCGGRYHLTIDTPLTDGEDSPGVSVDLSVTRRGV